MEHLLTILGMLAIIHLYMSRKKFGDEIKKLRERVDALESGGRIKPRPQATVQTSAPAPVVKKVPEVPSLKETPPPPPPPPPPRPSVPTRPNPVVTAVVGFFTGGNLVVRIGLVVLFFGITFLMKLAIDNGLIPIQVRLAAVAVAALALIVFGWRLREKRTGYALSLLGGGIAVLYLDIFAAFRLYQLIPSGFAFALLVLVVVFSSFIAVVLRQQSVAVIGICGGFLAPILTSSGGGSHVALFSYFLLLNLGILGIAWFRAWRVLNLLGFFFTFILGASWGAKFYEPDLFATTEPFLITFFILYSIIPLLFASRVGAGLKGFVDTTLVFGTPIVAFGLQIALVHDTTYGLAWSSLALAVYYITLTWFLKNRAPAVYRALTESMLAIGIVFVTLTIPLRMSHQWTCLSWALEGAALVWVGVRQNRLIPRLFGVLVLFAAGFAYRTDFAADRGMIFLNPSCIGAVFISVSALFGSYWFSRHRDRLLKAEAVIPISLFVWGLGWWFFAGASEIRGQMLVRGLQPYLANAQLFFIVASLATFEALHRPLAWPLLRKPVYLLLPFLAVFFTVYFFDHGYRPLTHFGWIVWPAGFAAHYWFLRRIDRPDLNLYERLLHAGGLFLAAEVLCFESARWFSFHFQDTFFDPENLNAVAWEEGRTWLGVVGNFCGIAAMTLVAFFRDKVRWPLKAHAKAYLEFGITPMAFLLWIWIFQSLSLSGVHGLAPYIPIFNPLELLQGFYFLAALAWLRSTDWRVRKPLYFVLGLTVFLWINILLARSVSYWLPLPYSWNTLTGSLVFQTSLTIYWSLLAMTVMVIGTRKKMRGVWAVGASLLGLTVLKLFFVDLSKTQTIARVVSFVGAGVLILLIGYFSPLPPKPKKEEGSA